MYSKWLHNSTARSESCPITERNFPVPLGITSRHTSNAVLRQAGNTYRACAAAGWLRMWSSTAAPGQQSSLRPFAFW
jgi:hypothetical protein